MVQDVLLYFGKFPIRYLGILLSDLRYFYFTIYSNYYRRWASAIGPAMSELIDRLLKSSKHEEQSYNACAGILHKVKTIPKGAAEEVARKCIEINSCKYFTFKQMLKKMDVKELPEHSPGTLPNHENISGKDYYK